MKFKIAGKYVSLLLLGSSFIVINSCSHSKNDDEKIIIQGNVERVKSGKIYLIDLSKRDIVKDSANIVNGRFVFKYTADSNFSPFKAFICMPDHYKDVTYLRPIGFVDPYSKNTIESEFYVDRGITDITSQSGDNGKGSFCSYVIKGSRQNIPYYKGLNLHTINHNESYRDRRTKIITDSQMIAQYSYSIDLAQQLYDNRGQYNIQELQSLMAAFSNPAKSCPYYKKMLQWTMLSKSETEIFPSLKLESDESRLEAILDSSSLLNVVVFWASWCGPCREEISTLKQIYSQYNKKDLSITSISVDNNKDSWITALSQEKMPWRQLLVNDSIKSILDVKYNLSAIPILFIISSERKIMWTHVGFSPIEIKDSISFFLGREGAKQKVL